MQSRLEKTLILLTILFCCAAFTNGAPGDLDLTFNGTGKVTTVVSSGSTTTNVLGAGIAVQADGKTVMTGLCSNGTNNDFCLVRYNTDGSLDTTFDGDGKVLTPLGTRFDNSLKLAIQPDGKIVVVGTYQFSSSSLNFAGAVARFNSNGSLDTTFSSVGFRFVIMEIAASVVVQPDGKIVIAGYTTTTSRAIVQRVNANGSDDGTFGNNGTSGYIEITFAAGRTDIFNSVALQPDGKIVAAGSSAAGSPQFAVARLTSAGLLDTTFDADGLVITPGTSTARSVFVQTDGKIVAAGNVNADFALARYNANGSLDTSFDTDGIVTTNIIGSETGYSALLQPNGKIVLGGVAGNVNGNDFALARYNVNGSLDTTFSSDGLLTIDMGATTNETGYSTAIDSSGRILIGGISNNLFAVARVTGDTAFVPSIPEFDFDGDGRADLSVFRPNADPAFADFQIRKSSDNLLLGYSWGLPGDKLAPADYDGDGKTDVAVWREAEGNFYILNSATGTVRLENFGLAGDVLTVGDWDGDGKADLSTFRNGTQSNFFYRGSLNNPSGNITYYPFGTTGDRPLRGDFDGDGKLDAAVFRPSNNIWYIRQSSDGAVRYESWGISTDKFVAADYDGDAKTDLAVFRNGVWYIRQSSNNQPRYEYFGVSSDLPVPADYDGDGKADIAVFRNGQWYLNQSTSGAAIANFGLIGDAPVPNAYINP